MTPIVEHAERPRLKPSRYPSALRLGNSAILGGAAGAVLGTLLGPLGAIVGAVLGASLNSAASGILFDADGIDKPSHETGKKSIAE